MRAGEILTWIAISILGGMKSVYGIDLWKGNKASLSQVCLKGQTYLLSGVWFFLYGLIGSFSGGSLLVLQSADLLCTYGILAMVDGRRRIVPDGILLCYFAGQMLWGALGTSPGILLHTVGTGAVFAGLLLLFVWLSGGKMGMGDVRLLGVTAMTAGWLYTLQVLFVAMGLSFIYSICLLLQKRSLKTEFPFVPFLAAGMVIQMIAGV
ncbi:MAG: prepilin peptidase [Lachnospiraceae bacterium]|nr:prepilin peptidase [Lachnospiraceae bacterium]